MGYSEARLYDGFLEMRLHPNELINGRQIMALINENLKTTTVPTDFMAIFHLAADHQRHLDLFDSVACLAL